MTEEFQKDREDRGEIRTVFQATHSDIQGRGVKMCKTHSWKKLTEMEVACTLCPTALIVNADALDTYLQNA